MTKDDYLRIAREIADLAELGIIIGEDEVVELCSTIAALEREDMLSQLKLICDYLSDGEFGHMYATGACKLFAEFAAAIRNKEGK